MNRIRSSKRRGFTLIELLVVIAIIAILAAILFPVFAKARDKARQTTCLSNLKQLNMAWKMYLDDWEAPFRTGWSWGVPKTHGFLHTYLYCYTGSPYPVYNATQVNGVYPYNLESAWDVGAIKAYPMYYCPNNPGIMYHQNNFCTYAPRNGRVISPIELENAPHKLLLIESYHETDPNNRYWAGDAACYPSSCSTRLARKHSSNGQNVAYTDGSAGWINVDKIDITKNGNAYANYWLVAQE